MVKKNKQILIKPINIDKMETEKYLVGKTIVYSRDKRFKTTAKIFLCIDTSFNEEMGHECELYKIVIRKKHVVAYCLLYKENNRIQVPLFGSTDTHYRVGHILSQITIDRMYDLDCDGIDLTASWNSILHHYTVGFRPKNQKPIDAQACDNALKNNNIKEILKIGCLPMYLPQIELNNKYNNFKTPILDYQKIIDEKSHVGNVRIYNNLTHKREQLFVYREDCDTEAEVYTICRPATKERKKQKIGKIILNYFYLDNGKYISNFGTDPKWSVFSWYGDEQFLDKTFAEYWSIVKTDEFDEKNIIKALFQIALEAGKLYDCPRLQIEADWEEHLLMYRYGFRTQFYDNPKTAEEICEIILNEEKNASTINLNKLGSVDMFLERANIHDKQKNNRVLYVKCKYTINRQQLLHHKRQKMINTQNNS